jgi:Phytanoyl-CoA dioxygenase (PhyH)
MPQLVTFAPDAAPETVTEALRRDGAVIIADLMAPGQADRLAAELAPYIAATADGQDSFAGRQTTRTGALAARSAECRNLLVHPAILAQCEAILKPNCERYHVHLTQAIRLKPGQPAQAIHRDRWAWGTYLDRLEPQLNTIWAVTDFTVENGATQVVPGSVDWPDDRRPAPEEIGQAVMSRGSVLVYLGSVFHAGGENRSEGDRIGLNLTYALGWLRQEENQYLACPPDIARRFDRELQALLGYTMGSYALGYYSPPLPPGEGPEIVSPSFALSGAPESGLGGEEMRRSIAEKTSATELLA